MRCQCGLSQVSFDALTASVSPSVCSECVSYGEPLKLLRGLRAWNRRFLCLIRRNSVGLGNFSSRDVSISVSISYSVYSEIAAPSVFFSFLRGLAYCASLHSVCGFVDTINSIFSTRWHPWFSNLVLLPTALGCSVCGVYTSSFLTKFCRTLFSRAQLFVRSASQS